MTVTAFVHIEVIRGVRLARHGDTRRLSPLAQWLRRMPPSQRERIVLILISLLEFNLLSLSLRYVVPRTLAS
jgi:hypothetical protein